MRSIVDAHHHLWQLGRFPYAWLAPDSPARPFGDHGGLKRDYLLADYLHDMAGLCIVGSVFVEANAGAPMAEVEWVDGIAGNSRLPGVTVGSLDLRRPDVAATLRDFQRSPRIRGVRMSLAWHERPQWRFVDRPDVMLTGEFRAGLAELTARGLILDTLVMPAQLVQLAELASANPDQVIVLNHLGTPWFDTPTERELWTSGMKACASRPNIHVKLSGLWPLDRRWRPEIIGEPVRYVVDLFGPSRCIWASNYPVEKLMCPVVEQIGNLEEALLTLTQSEMDMVFHDTAKRVYRIA